MTHRVPYTDITLTDEEMLLISKGKHPLCKEYTINDYPNVYGLRPEKRMSDSIRMGVPSFRVVTEFGEGDCVMVEICPFATYPYRYGIRLDSGKYSHFVDGIAYFSSKVIKVLGVTNG